MLGGSQATVPWGTRSGKLATLLGPGTCKRAAELSLAQWPPMHDVHATAWSSIAIREEGDEAHEEAGKQTWHTYVDRLPSTLPRRSDLQHLSMMLIRFDKYHVEMHLGSNVGQHAGLVRRTVVC